MMAAIAGLIAKGRTTITDGQWVDVSFPGFFHVIDRLRAWIIKCPWKPKSEQGWWQQSGRCPISGCFCV